MTRSALCVVLFFALALVAPVARADEAQERAAKAFADGERAFAAGNYRRAAVSFEEAYVASPHPSTLFNAAKARAKSDDLARAATLYARVEAESPSPRDREEARVAREALLSKIGRVQVIGEFEQASVDGVPVSPSGPSYVEPGEHVVTGSVDKRTVRKVVRVGAGEVVAVPLGAPEAPPPALSLPPPQPAREESKTNAPRVAAFVLGGAAIVAGGITMWSGFDTLAQKDQFDRTGEDRDLDDGFAKQTRTNVLLAVSLGLVAVTGIVAYLSMR